MAGFPGNPDIYGIGIRVGYYTQAASIWVSNFYAQHEAPYIHTVTLMFLIALLVGVCALCKNPEQTYAVEPFMLMNVAYNTMYMGLWDPRPPELLIWEMHFKKKFMVDIVWIALHCFDVWYWWIGLWKMKPSNSPEGTLVLFNYIGRVDLFAWVSIPARVFNAFALIWLLRDIVLACLYHGQQKRMDHAITPARFKQLTSRWLPELEHPYGSPHVITLEDTAGALDIASLPNAQHSRNSSKLSNDLLEREKRRFDPEHRRSLEVQGPDIADGSKNNFDSIYELEKADSRSYRRPKRSSTGLLKRGLLRWPSRDEKQDDVVSPPEYTAYEPRFQDIYTATKFINSCFPPPPKLGHFQSFIRCMSWPFVYVACLLRLIFVLVTHPFHPAALLAVLSHGSSFGHEHRVSYPNSLTSALRNPSYRTLDSRDIVLASRVSLTSNPPPKSSRAARFGLGWGTFSACSVLVISTELTIIWNDIHNVNSLGSVGQLIPFCLGVGGLLKVVWAAVVEKEEKEDRVCYYGRCDSAKRRKEWKEAAEDYQRCSDVFEASRMNEPNEGNKADV